MLPQALVVLGLVLLIGAALHDVAVRTVPNCIPAALAVIGIAARLISGDVLISLAVAAAVFLVVALLWLRGYMGGADAKLLAAVALIAPPGRVLDVLLMIALSGGALAVFYLLMSRLVRRPAAGRRHTFVARLAKAERWRLSRRGPLPYAIAIASGSMISLFSAVAG
jgi:prepilin peptidase CpaA